MQDRMLEEIWRVQAELVRRHGGEQAYLNYLRALDGERAKTKRKDSEARTASSQERRRAAKAQNG